MPFMIPWEKAKSLRIFDAGSVDQEIWERNLE